MNERELDQIISELTLLARQFGEAETTGSLAFEVNFFKGGIANYTVLTKVSRKPGKEK